MRRLNKPSHLDLGCLQKPIIIACGSERVKTVSERYGVLQGYRKAFGSGHVEPGQYGFLEMTTQAAPSPLSPGSQSPVSLVQPRHKNRGSYVQRWKVLRDRNKNLPKLDFNAKATGVPKVSFQKRLRRAKSHICMHIAWTIGGTPFSPPVCALRLFFSIR